MDTYDQKVIDCFIENQLKYFPKKVADNSEEALEFLEEYMPVVLGGIKEVIEYFDAEGVDVDGLSDDDIEELEEVFAVGDGRYLVFI